MLKPITIATNTKASHPRMALRRCWTLQRPTRAAMLLLVWGLVVLRSVVMAPASAFRGPLPMRLAGVSWCGFIAPLVRFTPLGPDEELRREGGRGGGPRGPGCGAGPPRVAPGPLPETRGR